MENCVLGLSGMIIPDMTVRDHFKHKYQDLLKKLTIRTKQRVGPDKVARMYKLDTVDGIRVIHLPRATSAKLIDNGTIQKYKNIVPSGRKINVDFQGELMPNQVLVVDKLISGAFSQEHQDQGFATATLDMPAGHGKSFAAASLIARLQLNTLYIVIRGKLQEQAVADLSACFPDAKICQTDGSKYAEGYAKIADVLVMVVNSVMDLPESFFAMFGLIIIDEVHTFCSQKRAELFWKCQTRCVLGMSGTTHHRSDGFDSVYHKHFGEPIVAKNIPGYDSMDTNFKGHVTAISYFGKPLHTQTIRSEATGSVFFPAMVTQFANDPDRNNLILSQILALFDDASVERNIFVFSGSRDHLDTIERMLKIEFARRKLDDKLLFAPELCMMRGGTKTTELQRANESRIILTTYGYSSTGISIPKMNSCVFATPLRNGFAQICARAMRRGSDVNIVRKFIDVIDSGTTIKGQYYSRKNAYDVFGFTIDRGITVDMRVQNKDNVDVIKIDGVNEKIEPVEEDEDSDDSE
jgi:superfamily II DNA or RNA helicase